LGGCIYGFEEPGWSKGLRKARAGDNVILLSLPVTATRKAKPSRYEIIDFAPVSSFEFQ
jgi:hypothetical protein